MEEYGISEISNTIEVLREKLEKKAELKGYNDPEVLNLSQELDRYIAKALSHQLRMHKSKSESVSHCCTSI